MSSNDFEQRFQHHVEFMLEQQSRFDERLSRLEESHIRQSENIDKLAATVAAMQAEMRDDFENLIVANEVTRKLSEDVARLAMQTAQRVTNLEQQQ